MTSTDAPTATPVSAGPTGPTGTGPSGPGAAPRSSRFRLVLLGVLVVALLASAGTLVWLVAERRGEATDVQRSRESAMAQARQFMLRVNTYGPDLLEGEQMPDYRKLVTEVITPKFATSFEEGVAAAEQTVAQAGVSRTAEVSGTGISVIDSDSATALVAGSFTNSYPDPKDTTQRIDDEPLPFRVEVKLVRTKGTWLVDDFSPVTGAEQ